MSKWVGLLLAPLVLAGCWEPTPFNFQVRIHNAWADLEGSALSIHATIVQPGGSEPRPTRVQAVVDYRGAAIPDISEREKSRIEIERIGSNSSRDVVFPIQLPDGKAPLRFYMQAVLGTSDQVRFASECVRWEPNLQALAVVDVEQCSPRPYNWPFEEPTPPANDDRRALFWDCCGLRTFPAYDSASSMKIPLNATLVFAKAFPVQAGAISIEASARVTREGALATAGGQSVELTVVDNFGKHIGKSGGRLKNEAHVTFDDLNGYPNLAVFRALVNATGVPGDEVTLVVHVNDGRQPKPAPD